MTRDELKESLLGRVSDEFVDSEILARRPWIFGTDGEHNSWCTLVATTLEIRSDQVYIVGSAATGYSLSPLKPGRAFRKAGLAVAASDIDVAITDERLFVQAWNTIIFVDRGMSLRMTQEDRAKMRLDVYWGVVSQRSLPGNTDIARLVLTTLSVAGRNPPLRGHKLTCRVYRRLDDLRAYHISSLRRLRAELNA
jgi:hypothetical protein